MEDVLIDMENFPAVLDHGSLRQPSRLPGSAHFSRVFRSITEASLVEYRRKRNG